MKHLIVILLMSCCVFLNAQYYSSQPRYYEIGEIDTSMRNVQASEKIIKYNKHGKHRLTMQHYKYNDIGQLIYYAEKFKGQKLTTTTFKYANGKVKEAHIAGESRNMIDGKRDKQWLITNTSHEYRYSRSLDTVSWFEDLFNNTVFKPNYMPIGIIILNRDNVDRLIQLSEIDTLRNTTNNFTWQYDSAGRKTLSIHEADINGSYWSCLENESIYRDDNKSVVHVSNLTSANELSNITTTCRLNSKGQIVCCKRKGFISRIYYYKNGLQKSAISWNKGKITTTRYRYEYKY